MVVGVHEELQVRLELFVAVVVVALDGGDLGRAVHALDLPIGPRVVHLSQAMLDAVLCADPIEDVDESVLVTHPVAELDAVIGQHDVDAVGHSQDQVAQKLRRLHLPGTFHKADEGGLVRTIDCHEQAQLALFSADLGQIDVEVADRVVGEAILVEARVRMGR